MHKTVSLGEFPVVVFSHKDKATLLAAAHLLEELRRMRQDAIGDPERDDDVTVDIAMAGHTCRELSEKRVHDLG